MKNNDEEEKINWWRRFINYFLSFFRLRRNPDSIKKATSVVLEKAASLHNITALPVAYATVAASAQSSPEVGLSAPSSSTLSCLQDVIEASTNSEENGRKNTNASLSISEGKSEPQDSHAFNCLDSSDIELIKYLLLVLNELPDDVADVILHKLTHDSDPIFQTEDTKQVANEEDPSKLQLLERLRNIPAAVYAQVNNEERLKEEDCLENGADREFTPYNSPKN